ncbi:MAG: hypothetical protein M3O62_13120 [Pseudomonadota bacterium]|nr:hypothetical protein [Pseudomonadota bacterium]
MLRIYDESQFKRRTRLKRLQVLALFVGGTLSGAWFTSNDNQWLMLPAAQATHSAAHSNDGATQKPLRASTLRSCFSNAASGLRIDCQLSLPELPRAEGV